MEGICYSPEYIKKVKAAGYYAKLTDTVVVNEEKYNIIMAEIAAAETEVEAEFKAEQPEAVKAEEEKKTAADKKENEMKKAWAEKINGRSRNKENRNPLSSR